MGSLAGCKLMRSDDWIFLPTGHSFGIIFDGPVGREECTRKKSEVTTPGFPVPGLSLSSSSSILSLSSPWMADGYHIREDQ